MPNIQRGEISAVFEGEERVLCLTLGALAELEAPLQAGDLVGLSERFASGRVSARDLLRSNAEDQARESGTVAGPSEPIVLPQQVAKG